MPVVRFSNGTTVAIQPESWNITRNGAIVATRTQLPLDLAWAFSVHKSQVDARIASRASDAAASPQRAGDVAGLFESFAQQMF